MIHLVTLFALAEDLPVAEAEPEPEDDLAAALQGTSFGKALARGEDRVKWSGYADFAATGDGDDLQFDLTHFNPILGARLDDALYAEIELEYEHGGSQIKMEYAWLDVTPAPAVTVRIGKFLVPIGTFNDTLHPSFRWVQVSRPGSHRDVIPAVWSEVGVQAYGAVGGAVRVDYAAYVVNGLGGTFDPAGEEPVRALRENVVDLDVDKAVGGRVQVHSSGGTGRIDLGVSGYSGATAVGGPRVSIGAVTVGAGVGPVRLDVEAASNWATDANDGPLGNFEEGGFALLAVKAGKLVPSARLDVVGTPAGTSEAALGCLLWQPYRMWSLRAEGGADLTSDGAAPRWGAMSAFMF